MEKNRPKGSGQNRVRAGAGGRSLPPPRGENPEGTRPLIPSPDPAEDIASVLVGAGEIAGRLDRLAEEIAADYRGRELTILAVLNGAVVLVSDLMRRLPIPVRFDWLSVASYRGGTETTGRVSFDRLSPPDLAGRHVLVVDDILDTGLTLAAIRDRLLAEIRPASARFCVLLRKRRERLAAIEADYVGFDIADEFVVGYGLDFDGRYRNLPFIGLLRPGIASGNAPGAGSTIEPAGG
jgi:hypoxanthine phosphoribosyltransferase